MVLRVIGQVRVCHFGADSLIAIEGRVRSVDHETPPIRLSVVLQRGESLSRCRRVWWERERRKYGCLSIVVLVVLQLPRLGPMWLARLRLHTASTVLRPTGDRDADICGYSRLLGLAENEADTCVVQWHSRCCTADRASQSVDEREPIIALPASSRSLLKPIRHPGKFSMRPRHIDGLPKPPLLLRHRASAM